MKLRRIDFTVLFARDMARMRGFYQDVLGLQPGRELGPQWVEYPVGENTLALTERGMVFDDPSPPPGALSAQLAFELPVDELAAATDELVRHGVAVDGPTDQAWGHRTVFFRDPDGNVLELYANL